MRSRRSSPASRFFYWTTLRCGGALRAIALIGLQVPLGGPAQADAALEIPTVTVTANRREENLQDVPMAISVVTAAEAAEAGISDPQSLAASVPGLTFNRQANNSIPFLRGVGSPVGEVGDEPSVAFYVDDVYLPAAAASLASLGRIDRIEVEKGPQGTVFGRNATGGVVQVYTPNPSAHPEAELSAGYANYDTTSGSLYASGPLADTLSANISLEGAQQRDGWGHYLVANAEAFTGWDYGGRAKLLWAPTRTLDVLLSVDYHDLRTEEGLNFRAFPGTGSLNPLPPFPNGGFAPPAGYYDTNQNLETYTITRQSGVSLKVMSDLSWAQFVNIVAWRLTKAVDPLDEDAGPLPLVNAKIATGERTWTEEMRLLSADGSKTQWIAGVFYFSDVSQYMPLGLSGAAFAPLPFLDSFTKLTTGSWAGFAQATHGLFPATNLTLGLRYTTDHRRLDASGVLGGGAAIPASNSPQSATWSKVTDRIVLDHHYSDDLISYLAYNRGFKSGLFNPVVFPGAPIGAPVAPEVLDAYTAGAKSDLLEHRLRLNTEAFYYRYKNIQVDQIVSGTTQITNAAAATIKGIDLDITMVPVSGLRIAASLEAMTGHYDSFPNGLFFVYNPSIGGNCTFAGAGSCPGPALPPNYAPATRTWDLKGNHTVQTPPFSSSLTVSYDVASTVGALSLAVNWNHTGNYYADADNGLGQGPPSSPANDRQALVDLLNASVTWTASNDRWQARLWGKNLSDQRYWSFAVENAFLTQYTGAPPRTYGVSLTLRL